MTARGGGVVICKELGPTFMLVCTQTNRSILGSYIFFVSLVLTKGSDKHEVTSHDTGVFTCTIWLLQLYQLTKRVICVLENNQCLC